MTGLLVLTPLCISIYFVWWLLNSIDSLLPSILPSGTIPKIPGLGILILLAIIIVIGWLFTSLIGEIFWRFYEKLLAKLPILSTIYNALKQISETFLSKKTQAFSHAVMVEYPKKDTWTIGFITASPKGEILQKLGTENDTIMVYVPTTPNPTSGFLLIYPVNQVKILDMPVDHAIKLVISLGIVE